MSAHGISPAWDQRNKFASGEPWIFEPTVILSFFLNCEINQTPDISQLITTLTLDCLVVADGNDFFEFISFNLSCFVEVL